MQAPDCLIVGGGLAGAMAGMRLAAAGRDVLLLEKERAAHHKVCGEFLSPEAVSYLQQAGVDPLNLGAVPIRNLRLSVGRRQVETTLPFRALSLSRCVLDAALLARAEQQGCTVRRGVSVERVTPDQAAWVAEIPEGEPIRARNLFLATGKHDVRGWNRGPGVQGDLVGFKMHWRLTPTQTEALRERMELFLFSEGYGGLALIEGDAANLCLVIRNRALRKLGGWPELLDKLLTENKQIATCLEGAQPLWERPLAISSIPYGYLSGRPEGMWCVGDQAAVIPSFTGDGMSIALHSGALAAEMFLAGSRPDQYHQKLRGQLRRGMSLATLLSRAMITRTGQLVAPNALALYPQALRWIAAATRIPQRALLSAALR